MGTKYPWRVDKDLLPEEFDMIWMQNDNHLSDEYHIKLLPDNAVRISWEHNGGGIEFDKWSYVCQNIQRGGLIDGMSYQEFIAKKPVHDINIDDLI